MRRAIAVLLLLVFAVGGALYLARVGGTVEIKVGDAWIGTTLPVALMLLAAMFLVLHLLFSAIGALRRWPERARQKKLTRRRAEGDVAMTRALVALAAGTGEAARLEMRKARNLLGETPHVLLLTAEAERLAGREDAATEAFRKLADRADARFLGLRGLLRQAMQKGDYEGAHALALEAEKVQPGAAWLKEERAQLAMVTRDWRSAMALASPGTPRAALALAAAADEADAAKAAELERQAWQADKGFAPAALAHARRLAESGSPRRARAVLEESWAVAPHPDLAPPYLADETDAIERVKAVDVLTRRNPNASESRLLLAQATLAAGLTGRARAALQALSQSGEADRRAFLALAELEEAEQGDTPASRAAQGRWLREAATAPPAPQWRCGHCGREHVAWQPVCDGCGTVGQIGWTAALKPALPSE